MKPCKTCGELFIVKKRRIKFCSQKCIRYDGPDELKRGDLFLNKHEELQRLMKLYDRKVLKNPAGCWSWIDIKSGYGTIKCNNKIISGHVASWLINYGEIPEGMWVLHSCDNRSCSNPTHLFLGSPKDNSRDMISKKRNNPVRGSKHYSAKLNELQVSEIKKLLELGYSQYLISRHYTVSRSSIEDIKFKRTWVAVPSALNVPSIGKTKKEYFQRGEDNSSCKLDILKVREIRELISAGWSQPRIAQKYGVSRGAIQGIKDGRNWKDV